MVDRVLGRC